MAKIVRYGGNLKAFASEQQTNERTLFGQVTIANDLTSQVTAQFLRGWGIVGPSDQPSLQDFNAAMYTHGQLLAYLHQMGVAEYNAAQEYFIGSVTQTGGVLYMSLTDANIGNAPSSSPANWKAFTADQATEIALGLVKIATQVLTNAGADDTGAVTPKKLAVATQGQKHTAFTATGTATAQVLTPVPAITAYAATQRFNVTFNIASGANPTINISGQGAKFLKQYDSTGAKVAAVFAAGHISDIVYDGTDWVLMDPLPPTGLNTVGRQGAAKLLKGSATGLDTAITHTYDDITLKDPSNNYVTLPAGSISPALNNANGANGLDAGVSVANTWYYSWVIYNPTTQVKAGLLSLSSTAPTMPSGFTFRARVGAGRTDSTAAKNFLIFTQEGNICRWGRKPGTNITSPRQITSGTTGLSYVATSVANYAPVTAYKVSMALYATNINDGVVVVAPNANYGVPTAGSPAAFTSSVGTLVYSSPSNASPRFFVEGAIVLESTNIYYLSNFGTSEVIALGWEDAL